MIVVDTSALMAIYLREADALRYEHAMFDAAKCVVAAPIAFEFLMVAQGRRGLQVDSKATPETALRRPGLRIEPWTERHVALAHAAFTRFGKGQGHPAQLNFGDCMSYALARSLDVPLLYKGGDFALTDVKAALPPA